MNPTTLFELGNYRVRTFKNHDSSYVVSAFKGEGKETICLCAEHFVTPEGALNYFNQWTQAVAEFDRVAQLAA
jgi:hypothetical protein